MPRIFPEPSQWNQVWHTMPYRRRKMGRFHYQQLQHFLVRVRLTQDALAAFEAAGNKYVVLGSCLFCDDPAPAGLATYAPKAGADGPLAGFVSFYSFCKQHAHLAGRDPTSRLVELAHEPQGRLLITFYAHPVVAERGVLAPLP